MPGIDFQHDLNPEQCAAALAPDGPVLVIAAAGTGKTRTLTYRVAHLVERGVSADRILLLTFTNRAAREMLKRARSLVGEGVSGLWGGTFHHLANRILRRHASLLGYGSDYSILDQDDAKRLMRQCTDDLGLKDKHFPKPDVLLSMAGLSASTGTPLETYAKERFEHHPVQPEDVVRVCERYTQRKKELNSMDFDDLLVKTVQLFHEQPEVLARYQDQFMHILVDEYQDTNLLQATLIHALSALHRNLLVVGDDFQSIYSWRGADFRNILNFPETYPDAEVFKLETNYRSAPEILSTANACIAGNPEQFQKTLKAVRDSCGKPVLARFNDGMNQGRWIIEQIRELQSQGTSLNEIAILYRSHFHAMELQILLTREKCPFVITSGVRFFEQVHIKDCCALLRLFANPGDQMSFTRLLELLPRVGQRTALKIWNQLDQRFNPAIPTQVQQLEKALPKAALESWSQIADILPLYREQNLQEHPAELLQLFIDKFYDDYASETFDNYPRRKEDLGGLVEFTAGYTQLYDFLSEVALISSLDAEQEQTPDTMEAIRLSTIHQAKGLEWKVVFILWLADGLFPSMRSLDQPGQEAEERRLFYVAVTRAKDHLALCAPSSRRSRDGAVQRYRISRFISEIPEDLFHTVRQTYY